jgi:hypothetical protein
VGGAQEAVACARHLTLAFTTIYQWGWVNRFLTADQLSLAMGIFLATAPMPPTLSVPAVQDCAIHRRRRGGQHAVADHNGARAAAVVSRSVVSREQRGAACRVRPHRSPPAAVRSGRLFWAALTIAVVVLLALIARLLQQTRPPSRVRPHTPCFA